MEARKEVDRAALATILSIIARAVYAIAVLVYVAFYTENFNTFQRIVVLLVALIIYATVESVYRVTRAGGKRKIQGWY